MNSEIALLNALSSSCPPPRADASSSSAVAAASTAATRWWLPCRGDEAQAIDGFLRGRLSATTASDSRKRTSSSSASASSFSAAAAAPPRALYIAGKPGTGKTASVARVLDRLQAYARQPGVTKGPNPRLRPFRLVRINGNHLVGNSSVSVFSEIARQTGAGGADRDGISASRKGGASAQAKRTATIADLEKMFVPKRKPSRRTKMTVVVIDEIDALLELGHGGAGGGGGGGRGSQASSSSIATQEALYRLFEWPCRRHSTLVLVSIANRIDLLSRFLPLLGRRGIEPTQIIFAPYDAAAVLEILQSRLQSVDAVVSGATEGSDGGGDGGGGGIDTVIKPEALELLARTIAKKSGDARRALDLFRRTVEMKLQKVRAKKAATRKRKRETRRGSGGSPGDGDGGEGAGSGSAAAGDPAPLSKQAKMRQVSQAINASYGSQCVSDIRGLSREAKIILCVFVCALQQQAEEASKAEADAAADAAANPNSFSTLTKAGSKKKKKKKKKNKSDQTPLKMTVLRLYEQYATHSRRVSHSPVALSTFVDLVQALINNAILALANPRQRLERRSELKTRVQMRDVTLALTPAEGTMAARARDAPTQPEARFYKRLMSAQKGPRGSYYSTADGRSKAKPGPEPSP